MEINIIGGSELHGLMCRWLCLGARIPPFTHLLGGGDVGADLIASKIVSEVDACFSVVGANGEAHAAILVGRERWDSLFFNKPVYFIRFVCFPKSNVSVDNWLRLLKRGINSIGVDGEQERLISCRAYPEEFRLLNALGREGFYLVDSQQHMTARSADLYDIRPSSSAIRLSCQDHGKFVDEFASQCVFPSRLTRDPFFPEGSVREMNRRWLQQICLPEKGAAFGVISGSKLVGFAGGKRLDTPGFILGDIGLNRILAGALPGRGMQGFYAMARLGAEAAKDVDYVEAVISSANPRALRMVERLGYKFSVLNYCFHRVVEA